MQYNGIVDEKNKKVNFDVGKTKNLGYNVVVSAGNG